jgi:hypothetical protein
MSTTKPGDQVRVHFGPRIIEGTVLRVRGDYMTISVALDDSDESIDRFVRTDSVVAGCNP